MTVPFAFTRPFKNASFFKKLRPSQIISIFTICLSMWLMLPISGCHPYRTVAVQESIRKVADDVLPILRVCCFSNFTWSTSSFWQEHVDWQKTCIKQEKEGLNFQLRRWPKNFAFSHIKSWNSSFWFCIRFSVYPDFNWLPAVDGLVCFWI